ncbi:MAG: hypothetical protein M1828_003446 [Chrysothrix sp. TS-e1954]|nr:MAG: hypothetical protein M1828_003446 [Chrysothrix sp. TS-e1954]
MTAASVVSEHRADGLERSYQSRRRHRAEHRSTSTHLNASDPPQDIQYWEQDLDVKLVFSFIRSRVASPKLSSSPSKPLHSPSVSDSLRRAALIRHQHPLIASPLPSTSQASSASPLSKILGRRQTYTDGEVLASSCASQSKKSKTSHDGSLSWGSSRNYWDFGVGEMGGGWGEV